jgi:DNA ligase-1
MNFATLYGNVSRGDKIKVWNISVSYDKESNTAKIMRNYGQLDGKQTQSVKEITQGKNIGKVNETSVYTQACNVAQSYWTKQKESGYVENKDLLEENVRMLPMLAHDYKKRHKSINMNESFVQPKIDGVRLMVSPYAKISRTGKPVQNMEHIDGELEKCFKSINRKIVFDGELFTFELPFEDISGCARQTKNVDSDKITKLKYYIFDCYLHDSPHMPFVERNQLLNEIFQKHTFTTLVLVETEKITNSIDYYHEKYVNADYEGIMIRNANSVYKLNYRSVDLQKYKTFEDKEYEIVDVKEATGNDKGTAIFVCLCNNEVFSVRPRGTRELRSAYWNNSQDYIGKMLTVRYQNFTENGLPRFPVGIAIRDYE